MAQRIQLRRGTAAEWTAANPILALGEPGVETDTGKQKFGDGVTAWNSRPYASKGDKGDQGAPGVADDASVAQQVTSGPQTTAALSATYAKKGEGTDRGLTAAGGPLSVPTYDGNPNCGHPSVVEIPAGFGGYRFWMAHTPYPFAGRENPSIVASQNGIDWETPPGLTNPVTGVAEIQAAGFNYGSDTHLIYHQNKLWMYYRIADNIPAVNAIFVKTSTNGVDWSAATKVVEDLVEGETTLNSPCIEVEADGTFTMWCANGVTTPPTMTRRTSPNGLAWSAPTNCVLPAGAYLWHMDVKRVGSKYYCLFNSREASQADQLYFFTSTDGITWTGDVKVPAVEIEAGSFPLKTYYRSALLPRVGTPLKWDVYTTLTGFVNAVETWRIGLIRDTTLPTLKQASVATKLAQERTDALFGIDRWLVGDSFARANAATLGNATTGQTWTNGAVGVIDRSAYATGGSTRTWVEAGAADVEVAFDLGAVQETWALFRVTDDSNWVRAGLDNTTGRFAIEKRVAGTITRLWTGSATIGAGYQARVGDRIRVVAKGNTISLYRNSLLVTTLTEAFNNTATKHGLGLVAASRAKAFAVGAAL